MTRADKFWTVVILLLTVAIVMGGLVILSRYQPGQPIELTPAPAEEFQGEILVSGAVNSPGVYPWKSSDSLADLIQAAGGLTAEAGSQFKLDVPRRDAVSPPQKVDLNRAGKWLLQALPGVGETRAQAILDYRQKNGRFRNINELAQVEGIGASTFERIKDLVTVGE